MNKAIIFDTETTGLVEPEIIEAAWVQPHHGYIEEKDENLFEFCARFKPSKPISLSAMAIHHIMDEDLVNCAPSNEFTLPADTDYLIGHNIDFDWQAAGKPEIKRICTLALSRHLWPELDTHTLSAMVYFLDRSKARDRLRGKAHSALNDVFNCILILNNIIKKLGGISSWEELWRHSEVARIPTKMMFGKHKGMLIKDVPRDYKAWLMKQPETDQYLMRAITS